MRAKYSHYLPLTPAELEQVWSTAIVTVDANVLLDLYRYHGQTRDRLLESLRQFAGRTWLSHQAAEEFFKNRSSVIAGSNKDFDEAEVQVKAFEKAAQAAQEKLRSLRLVPRELGGQLLAKAKEAVAEARSQLTHAQGAHPDYFTADPLLESVLSLFDEAVGPAPTAEERTALIQEGERRSKLQIPPGFLDNAKTGEDRYGDFMLWRQVLEHARDSGLPVILVTSERKEDWWDKHHGRRTGPRRELIAEAANVAKQRILIYETEYFIGECARRQGSSVESAVVEDIRQVGLRRGEDGSRVDLEDVLYQALEKLGNDLTDEDPVAGLIGETNASGFYPDDSHILSIGDLDLNEVSVPIEATIHFSGEHDPDQMWHGSEIEARVTGILRFDGTDWEIADYEVTAEILGMDDDPPEGE